MANPALETLRQIRDAITGRTFACTAREISLPFEWRTAIIPAATRHGAVDGHAGSNDYLSPRQIAVDLIHVYGAGESFRTVMRDLELVIGRGNPLELTFVEGDGTPWLWDVRLTKFDKKHARDMAVLATMPLAFVAPDPWQRAQFKPGINRLDDGLLLDNGLYLDEDLDAFALTGAITSHAVTNTGSAPDEAPIVRLTGPIVGLANVEFHDDAGNVVGFYYSGGIAAGETVTFDAEQEEVTSTNPAISAYQYFRRYDNQDVWGRLAPGANTVYIGCTSVGGSAACVLDWAPRK